MITAVSTTVQKMKISIKDLFNKREQIRSFLRICSHFLKKLLMENLIFCAVYILILNPYAEILLTR